MALMQTPTDGLGMRAPEFSLPDAAGREFTLNDVRGENGVVVMFICNHCPYVQAVIDRTVADMAALSALGVGAVAIMPNDYQSYPDDRPERMAHFAEAHRFGFPYLIDETQDVARAYGAVCTPDFYGFDRDMTLVYRGRLDAGRMDAPGADAPRELLAAMSVVAEGKPAPKNQAPSMGCSIKWRSN